MYQLYLMKNLLRSWHCWKGSVVEFQAHLVKFSRKEKNRFVALFIMKFKAAWGHKQYGQVTRLLVEESLTLFFCSLSPSRFSHFPSSLSLLAPLLLFTPSSYSTLHSIPPQPSSYLSPLPVILHGLNFYRRKIMVFKVIVKNIPGLFISNIV